MLSGCKSGSNAASAGTGAGAGVATTGGDGGTAVTGGGGSGVVGPATPVCCDTLILI